MNNPNSRLAALVALQRQIRGAAAADLPELVASLLQEQLQADGDVISVRLEAADDAETGVESARAGSGAASSDLFALSVPVPGSR